MYGPDQSPLNRVNGKPTLSPVEGGWTGENGRA